MNNSDLLNFVKDNADVADKVKAHDAQRINDKNDPWYRVIVRELRQKYEDAAMEADRDKLFD